MLSRRHRSTFTSRLLLGGLSLILSTFVTAETTGQRAVVNHYSDIAHAVYQDALNSAEQLQHGVENFLSKPSEKGLLALRATWKTARIPYQQSEAFRFGNHVVDDWEGSINSWPLDEGLIDYVDGDYEYALGNIAATFNIVNSPLINLSGDILDTKKLDPSTLKQLNELGGSEANVATGYHAIEFLLWGQDLHGSQLGAGERPYTDYVLGDDCSHGNCQRRGEYLLAASQLLVADLRYMVDQWARGKNDNYRAELASLPSDKGIARMLYGMGSLSLGELAGERIKVSLEANSTEDEHDCFSDNTHWSHYYNGLGIQNIYLGRYQKLDGSLLQGPSIHQLLTAAKVTTANATAAALQHSMTMLTALTERAESSTAPMKFDMMIAEGNSEGAAILEAILQALVAQTRALETAAKALNIDPNAMRD